MTKKCCCSLVTLRTLVRSPPKPNENRNNELKFKHIMLVKKIVNSPTILACARILNIWELIWIEHLQLHIKEIITSIDRGRIDPRTRERHGAHSSIKSYFPSVDTGADAESNPGLTAGLPRTHYISIK